MAPQEAPYVGFTVVEANLKNGRPIFGTYVPV
jgi:hypothetical protein